MNILAKIQRRGFVSGLFGGMAAAALANVARAQTPDPIPCQLGPSPHQKGPLVWLDMDQIELDAAYDQRFYAPMGDQIQKRVASISNGARAWLGEPLRLSYGPSQLEKLDVYRARKPNAPIFLFVHGGSWRGGSARNNAYPAEMVRQRRREFHCDRFHRHQAGRRRPSPDGRPSAKRHCLGLQERRLLRRRRCEPALHRRPLLRRTSDGR